MAPLAPTSNDAARPAKRIRRDNLAEPSKPAKKVSSAARVVSFTAAGAKRKEARRAPTPPPSKPKGARKSSPKLKSTLEDVSSSEHHLPKTFKIIAGSYERLLYGLNGSLTSSDPSSSKAAEWELTPTFMFPAHVSSVKAVAASPQGGKWLATGSTDEIIKVWDLRRRKEVGGLMHHTGSITQLVFPSRSHLLSASDDGTLALFRARDWAVLRTLKGHSGRINSVAVHPSGKVALSVGRDRTLRMWDLMRGKGSASTKLGVEGELVRWSSDGGLLVVQYQKTVDVYSTDLTKLHTISHPSRTQDVKFVARPDGAGEVLLVSAEDKKTTAYVVSVDPSTPPRVIATFVGHGNRVKAIDTLSVARPDGTPTTILGSVSSDGTIHVYDLYSLPDQATNEATEIEPAARYDTKGTRLTCLTLADGDETGAEAIGKRKREDGEEIEQEDEEEWESEVEEEGA